MITTIHVFDMDAKDLLALARRAEARGIDALWVGDHIAIPVGHESEHPEDSAPDLNLTTLAHDPWVALSAIAAVTTQLQLGIGVLIVPLRHPLAIARAGASVHDFSSARLSLGVGSGWLEEEFKALDQAFRGRGARFDEALAVMRTAWAGGPFEHHGPHFDFEPLQITPHPTPIPLIVGGNTRVAMRRAASVGSGWLASGTPTLDEAIALRERMRDILTELGVRQPFRTIVRPGSLERDLVSSYIDSGFDDLGFRYNRAAGERHGGWERWLDELCGALDGHAALNAVHNSSGGAG